MAAPDVTPFWGMTINNPTETDVALVRQGYPDYIKSLIHTPEQGKEGTEHLQCWIKMAKACRQSFMKKLFPRASFKALRSPEYVENTKCYVQKDDETTRGAHIIHNNDTLPDAVKLLETYCERWIYHCEGEIENITDGTDHRNSLFDKWVWQINTDGVRGGLHKFIREQQQEDVIRNPQIAKLLVGPLYSKIKKEYLKEILTHMLNKDDADDNESEQQDAGGEVGEEHEHQEATIQEADSGSDVSVSDSSTESGSQTSSGTDSGDEVRERAPEVTQRPKYVKQLRRVLVCDNGSG
jgi:hypothetical protein